MDSTQLLVPARTYAYLAEPGTPAPADASATLDPGWINVGHTTPDSMSFATSPEFDEVSSAQSDFPVRRFQTSESGSVSVDLLQWSDVNFQSAYGGGVVTSLTVATGAAPQYKFVPPKIGDRKEKSLLLEVIDGTKRYRYVFPRTFQNEGIENSLSKGAAATLALRMAILGSDVADAWYLLTNDPAFNPA